MDLDWADQRFSAFSKFSFQKLCPLVIVVTNKARRAFSPLGHASSSYQGSHDSFSYSLSADGEVGPDAPSLVVPLARLCPCLTLPTLLRWSITQRAPVAEQLTHGIRYFDIRVAAKDSRFYFVHGLYGDDLQSILTEIRKFLVDHPGEVVLLDFQHFHGLTPSDHSALTSLLHNTFNNTLCPVYQQPTLADLARYQYQVLVFYRDEATRQGTSWLWPSSSLPNPWPDTTSLQDMFTFLQTRLATRNPKLFFVTQCVLTPSGGYVGRHLLGRLENLARTTNQGVPAWVARLPGTPPGPNIVMIDFVDHGDWAVPKAVIAKNYKTLL